MECNRSHYYRNVEVDGDPIVEAIEELQEDVDRIDEKDVAQDGRMDGIDNDITDLDERLSERMDGIQSQIDNWRYHDHYLDRPETALYAVSIYGNDETGSGTYANPYRSIYKCLDKINQKHTICHIEIMEPGTYYAYNQEHPEYDQYFNGIFLFLRPHYTVDETHAKPVIMWGDTTYFFNSYLYWNDIICSRVNNTFEDNATHRFHLDHLMMIWYGVEDRSWRTPLHSCKANFKDCRFQSFYCEESEVIFEDGETAIAQETTPMSNSHAFYFSSSSTITFRNNFISVRGLLQNPSDTDDSPIAMMCISNAKLIYHGSNDFTMWGLNDEHPGRYRYGIWLNYGQIHILPADVTDINYHARESESKVSGLNAIFQTTGTLN